MAQKLRQDLAIGPVIREMRKKANLTQPQVVEKLQLYGCATTRSTYSRIEIGQYNIRVSELVALKSIFGVEYQDFFVGCELQ